MVFTTRAYRRNWSRSSTTIIRPALTNGTERWAVRVGDFNWPALTEMKMLRWNCGKTQLDKIRNEEHRKWTNTGPIEEVLRAKRLRWFGHVQRRESTHPSRAAIETIIDGKRKRRRPKKTSMEVLTSRDRPKSAPYPRLKNSKKTSKCQVFFYSTRKSEFFLKKLHTKKMDRVARWRPLARAPGALNSHNTEKLKGGTL